MGRSVQSFRFEKTLTDSLDRIARKRRTTRTRLVREAVEKLVAEAERPTLAELIGDDIGCFASGRTDSSTNRRRYIREILEAKRAAGRL